MRSFLAVAADSDFPLQNLPYGVFEPRAGSGPRIGVAISDQVLDCAVLEERGLLRVGRASSLFAEASLNRFAAMGPEVWQAVRARLTELLSQDCAVLRDDAALRRQCLSPQSEAVMHLPFRIGGFTDFYSSEQHATNVGCLFRDKQNPLLPNWKHLPVAYNGRASTIVVSGTDVTRPWGQVKPAGEAPPQFAPSAKMDFELEVGCFVGVGNAHGQPISVDAEEEHVFGLVLVNDWSARDHQAWEYVPLGPFLGKSFATTISPWVVSTAALAPFRLPLPEQESPKPLPYLRQRSRSAFNIELSVALKTASMHEAQVISRTNLRELYWSTAQQLAHHTINGCRMDTGDLYATGTISGKERAALGSLLEMTLNGQEPLQLSDGSVRRFLEDGDQVILRGYCQGPGYRVGFGAATGTIRPADQRLAGLARP